MTRSLPGCTHDLLFYMVRRLKLYRHYWLPLASPDRLPQANPRLGYTNLKVDHQSTTNPFRGMSWPVNSYAWASHSYMNMENKSVKEHPVKRMWLTFWSQYDLRVTVYFQPTFPRGRGTLELAPSPIRASTLRQKSSLFSRYLLRNPSQTTFVVRGSLQQYCSYQKIFRWLCSYDVYEVYSTLPIEDDLEYTSLALLYHAARTLNISELEDSLRSRLEETSLPPNELRGLLANIHIDDIAVSLGIRDLARQYNDNLALQERIEHVIRAENHGDLFELFQRSLADLDQDRQPNGSSVDSLNELLLSPPASPGPGRYPTSHSNSTLTANSAPPPPEPLTNFPRQPSPDLFPWPPPRAPTPPPAAESAYPSPPMHHVSPLVSAAPALLRLLLRVSTKRSFGSEDRW